MNLNKNSGINLTKGRGILLEKDNGSKLEKFCVGVNWGGIQRRGLWKIFGSVSVDLDASLSVFDAKGNLLDKVCYYNLRSKCGAISHSGDDLHGDLFGNDGRDNEVIELDLRKLSPKVHEIVFFMNSFKRQDFADIPYSQIRLFEGNSQYVKNVFASFDLASDPKFKGNVSMVMAKLSRVDTRGGWKFTAIGEPVPTKNISQTIRHIQEAFLAA